MKPELFDIWEDNSEGSLLPWRVQLVNYVGRFPDMSQAA